MPKYRVKSKSFIGNAICEEGDVVEYEGTPADNLEPMDKAGTAAASKSGAADIESLARQKVAAAGASPDAVDAAQAVSVAAAAAQAVVSGGTPAQVAKAVEQAQNPPGSA